MSLKKEKKQRKKRVEYNYYIDDFGLYFRSTIAGELYEEFDINGVCEVSQSVGVDILHLCYIDENDKSED
jgi:hypothetical protein